MPSTIAVISINDTAQYAEANPASDVPDPLTDPIKHPNAEFVSVCLQNNCSSNPYAPPITVRNA